MLNYEKMSMMSDNEYDRIFYRRKANALREELEKLMEVYK